jgi:hypothetical protein
LDDQIEKNEMGGACGMYYYLFTYLLTTIEFSLCGSSAYSSTENKQIRIYINDTIQSTVERTQNTINTRRMGRREMCAGFWWGNMGERDYFKDQGIDGRIILRCIFRKWDVGPRTGLIWLKMGTGSRHL